MICRKTTFGIPDANPLLPEHKKPDFVLEKPEIEGSEGLGAHGLCGRVANSAGNGCRLAGGQMLRHRTKNRKG